MSTGPEGENKSEYIRILEQRRVEGVILMGSMFATEQIKEAIQRHLSKVPVVIVNGYLDLPNVSGVLIDAGVGKCADLLISKGKKKLAFVLDQPSPANLRKQQGFCDAVLRHGASREDLLLYEAEESSVQGGYDVTVRILREHPDVQGIIYSIDLVAVGGIRAAHDLGVNVPEQLGIIGVDSSIYGEICMPKLTTLNNKLEEVSEIAATILREGLEGKVQNRKLMMFSEIIERESS